MSALFSLVDDPPLTLESAIAALCLCTEPHLWTTQPCPGPAPTGTPADTLLAAAISRALHVRSDPTGVLVEEDQEHTEKTGFTLDPADFDFYLATLARGLQRFAANPTGSNH